MPMGEGWGRGQSLSSLINVLVLQTLALSPNPSPAWRERGASQQHHCGTNSIFSLLSFSTALREYTSGKYSPFAHSGARSR